MKQKLMVGEAGPAGHEEPQHGGEGWESRIVPRGMQKAR